MKKNSQCFPNILPPYYLVHDSSKTYSIGQCDCACATTISTAPQLPKTIQEVPYVLHNPTESVSLTKDHLASLLYSGLIIYNRETLALANHFKEPRLIRDVTDKQDAFSKSIIQKMLNSEWLIPLNHVKTRFVEKSNTLVSWIHITDTCNLQCDYCYLPHNLSDMTLTTGYSVLDAIFRVALKYNYQVVKIKYAGGEPLLRFSMVLDLHRYARKLAKKYNLLLDGVILSNGTLLNDVIIDHLQEIDLRLMISLDGIEEYHNCQRHYANGQGSFTKVQHSIESSCRRGLIPDISITVTGRNASGLPQLMAWILERDLPFSLNFYRKHKNSVNKTLLEFEEEQLIENMLAAYRIIEHNLPQRSLLASLLNHANLSAPHLRTCNAGHNYLVFDTQGRIAKCQMNITNPVTNCHAVDPLLAVRQSTQGFTNPSVDEKEECSSCQWRYWCGGGCPLIAQTLQGNSRSPYCAIYKKLFPEIIRLEGLRILKWDE